MDEIVAMGRRAIAVKADVSRQDEVAAMFSQAVAASGTLHIVVAAGLQCDAPFEQMTLAQWNTVIGVNLTGQFLCAREAMREFNRRGLDTAGVMKPDGVARKLLAVVQKHGLQILA